MLTVKQKRVCFVTLVIIIMSCFLIGAYTPTPTSTPPSAQFIITGTTGHVDEITDTSAIINGYVDGRQISGDPNALWPDIGVSVLHRKANSNDPWIESHVIFMYRPYGPIKVKVEGLSRMTDYEYTLLGYSFNNVPEVKMFRTHPGVDNFALNKPIIASSQYDMERTPNMANDGDDNTIWASALNSGLNQEWIYINLESKMPVMELVIKWFDKYYATKYSIYISDDGKIWQHVLTDSNGAGGIKTLSGYAQIQYLGILFEEKNDSVIAIKEIELNMALPRK